MSASAVGRRLRFSNPCSMSRRFSRSPGCAGMAVCSPSDEAEADAAPSAKRMAAIRPGTRVRRRVPGLRSWGAASTRVVTQPWATRACCMRASTVLMPWVPRQRSMGLSLGVVLASVVGTWAAAGSSHWNLSAISPSSTMSWMVKQGVSDGGKRVAAGAPPLGSLASTLRSCCARNARSRSCWRCSSMNGWGAEGVVCAQALCPVPSSTAASTVSRSLEGVSSLRHVGSSASTVPRLFLSSTIPFRSTFFTNRNLV